MSLPVDEYLYKWSNGEKLVELPESQSVEISPRRVYNVEVDSSSLEYFCLCVV